MGRPIVITEEVFDKTKKLLQTGLFDRKQIAEMMNINKNTISNIARFQSVEEMRAANRAAIALSEQRRREKQQREAEAAAAFKKALEEPENEELELEQPKRVPIGDCPNTIPDDSIELKADVIIEKLDTLIELLKEVRVAQTSNRSADTHNLTTIFESNKPF